MKRAREELPALTGNPRWERAVRGAKVSLENGKVLQIPRAAHRVVAGNSSRDSGSGDCQLRTQKLRNGAPVVAGSNSSQIAASHATKGDGGGAIGKCATSAEETCPEETCPNGGQSMGWTPHQT
jgi:hypothetical protein